MNMANHQGVRRRRTSTQTRFGTLAIGWSPAKESGQLKDEKDPKQSATVLAGRGVGTEGEEELGVCDTSQLVNTTRTGNTYLPSPATAQNHPRAYGHATYWR